MVQEKEARRRAELILKVRSGLMTAADAARLLGVSRKTYYKWEKRALEGMMGALMGRPSGRPSRPVDGEKTLMKKEIEGLKKELLLSEQRVSIRDMLYEDLDIIENFQKSRVKKTKREK